MAIAELAVVAWCRRQENLQARITGKIEKKKEKRDKKLLRPGFEGRKSGFIGNKASPAAK